MIKHEATILKLIQRRESLLLGFPNYDPMKKATGLKNDSRVAYVLQALMKKGHIEKNGHGKYRVTQEGMKA